MRHWTVLGLLILSLTTRATGTVPLEPGATCAELLLNEHLTAMIHANVAQVENHPRQYAAALQQVMYRLIEHFNHPSLDFAYFEKFFRVYGLPFYLVANSRDLGPGFQPGYPPALASLKTGPALYHLWVGLKGKTEADNLKKQLGISDEENLVRLRSTGFIFVENIEAQPAFGQVDRFDPATRDRINNVSVHPADPP